MSSGQDSNIVGGKKTASRELPLTPDAFTRLPREGSSTLDGLRSFNRQALGHGESNESIGIDRLASSLPSRVTAFRFAERNRPTDPDSPGGELFRAPHLDGQGNCERGNRKIRRGQILPVGRPGQRPDRGGIFGEGVERATGCHAPAVMRTSMRSEQLPGEGIDHPDLIAIQRGKDVAIRRPGNNSSIAARVLLKIIDHLSG
jgi:hypothetical protein